MLRNILAIETSTAVCSVAIRLDGHEPLELRQTGSGIHSEMVFVFTEELLIKTDTTLTGLDGIILSAGPGSYTGLRVGSSAVKGMLFNSDVNFYAANTLAGIALGVKASYPEAERIHSVIDARRKHLYHQAFSFESGNLRYEEESSVKPLTEIASLINQSDYLAGTGIDRLPGNVAANIKTLGEEAISACNLIRLFDIVEGFQDESIYSLIKKVALEQFEPYY